MRKALNLNMLLDLPSDYHVEIIFSEVAVRCSDDGYPNVDIKGYSLCGVIKSAKYINQKIVQWTTKPDSNNEGQRIPRNKITPSAEAEFQKLVNGMVSAINYQEKQKTFEEFETLEKEEDGKKNYTPEIGLHISYKEHEKAAEENDTKVSIVKNEKAAREDFSELEKIIKSKNLTELEKQAMLVSINGYQEIEKIFGDYNRYLEESGRAVTDIPKNEICYFNQDGLKFLLLRAYFKMKVKAELP